METNLDVQVDPDNFPMTPSGNPKIGQFSYGMAGLIALWNGKQIIDLACSYRLDCRLPLFILLPMLYLKQKPQIKSLHGEKGRISPEKGMPCILAASLHALRHLPMEGRLTTRCSLETNAGWLRIWMSGLWSKAILEASCRPIMASQRSIVMVMIPAYCEDLWRSVWMGWSHEICNHRRGLGHLSHRLHIPGKAEWEELGDFLGGYQVAGGQLKEEGTAHWSFPIPEQPIQVASMDCQAVIVMIWAVKSTMLGSGPISGHQLSWRQPAHGAGTWIIMTAELGPGDGNWPYGFSLRCVQNWEYLYINKLFYRLKNQKNLAFTRNFTYL